jgi:1-acyl-sn-glycerol-3-phosphate acyltransferase
MSTDRWTYDTAPDSGLALLDRLARVPREPDLLVSATRLASAVVLRTSLRAAFGMAVEGAANLPTSGSFVLVSNHASHLDTALLLSMLPLGRLDRTYPLAAREYFAADRARALASAVAFNVLTFDRDVPACRAFDACRRLLSTDGNVLVVYPEGTRSRDGAVAPFKAGVGMLVAGLDVPVVPCFVHGTRDAWPKGARLPRRARVGVRVGTPLSFASVERSKAVAVAVAETLRAAVLDLSEGAAHVHHHRREHLHDPLGRALGRVRDLLPRLAPARADDARRRSLSSRP